MGKKRVEPPPGVPGPVATPRDVPDHPRKGWWVDPCQPVRGFYQRYHDGSKWTGYVSQLMDSKWCLVEERAYVEPPEDLKYGFLPRPERIPVYPPERPTKGWWTDPYRPGPDLTRQGGPPPGPLCQRFHDGEQWTPYIAYRVAGPKPKGFLKLRPYYWGGITEDPDPLGHPAPPLGAREIDDYSFLPVVFRASGDKLPDPPTMGWWEDPFGDFGQRFHNGKRWTQYSEFYSSRSGHHLLEVPAVPHHQPPAVEYNPGPLRTDSAFALAMLALLGGLLALGISAQLDHQGGLSGWVARVGLVAFAGGFGALLIHLVRMAFPPDSVGRIDSTNVFYNLLLAVGFGVGAVALRDAILRALWLR